MTVGGSVNNALHVEMDEVLLSETVKVSFDLRILDTAPLGELIVVSESLGLNWTSAPMDDAAEVAPRQYAVAGPAETCRHEQQIAFPNLATIKGMPKAGATHQGIAANDQTQAQRPAPAYALTQDQQRQ